MRTIVIAFISYFMDLMNMIPIPFSESTYWSVGLPLIFLLVGLLGYKLYRVLFSVIVLVGTIVLVVWLFGQSQAWIHVATLFSILSVALAFTVFFLKRLSAFFVVALIVLGYALAFNMAWLFSILLAVGVGVIASFFPLVMIVLMTSLLGAFEGAWLVSSVGLGDYYIGAVVLGLVLCLVVQIFTNLSEFRLFLIHRGHQDG